MRTRMVSRQARAAFLTALVGALAALRAASPAAADSLYDPDRARSMFADRRARALGDVITVQIVESTVATEDADSTAQRKLTAKADGGTGLFGILKRVPKATLGGSIEHKGSGSTSRSSKLATTIACRVVDVTPGGQLVVSGDRSVRVNADTQTIRFHGIIRPEDVDPENTIASTLVADARIEVIGRGPIDRHVKPGILSRVFQFLF
jgi:flagellar L-ring protein precursor FlgH